MGLISTLLLLLLGLFLLVLVVKVIGKITKSFMILGVFLFFVLLLYVIIVVF